MIMELLCDRLVYLILK